MNLRLLFLLCTAAGLAAAQPKLTHVDVFTAGESGYHTYRIPALVTASDGTLIAFAEARKQNSGDPGHGDIDLVFKRSSDNGATWSPLKILDDPGEGWSASNPTPLTDRDTRRVWIFYNRWEPGHGTATSLPGTSRNQTWARFTENHGETWSAPIDLTRAARDYDQWGAMFLGPGGAIQTRSGRLLIPSAMRPDAYEISLSAGGFSGRTLFMRSYALFSDDHGKTWQRGALLRALTDENQFVELADGSIMIDARQATGNHRWIAISSDGGQTWSEPLIGQTVTPIAVSIERFDNSRLLWVGPAGPGRRRLVARLSGDEGQTYSSDKVIYGGLAAYSDIAMLRDGSAGVLWERGVSRGYQFITFTRLTREFLDPQ
jgi:sialidase-1